MKTRRDWIPSLLLLLVSVVVAREGVLIPVMNPRSRDAPEAGGWLLVLAFVLAVLAAVYLVQSGLPGQRSAFVWGTRAGIKRALLSLAALVAYVLVLGWLGYMVSTITFLIAYLRFFGGYRWAPVVIGSLLVGFASARLWEAVGVMLPLGIFTGL